jgi:hypothetical protein
MLEPQYEIRGDKIGKRMWSKIKGQNLAKLWGKNGENVRFSSLSNVTLTDFPSGGWSQ